MKLLVINPIVNTEFDRIIAAGLAPVLGRETTITVVSPARGPKAIENFTDEAEASPYVIELVRLHEKNFDGILINCFADLAVNSARELTKKPVLGAGEGAFFTTALLGVPFSIITIGSNARNKMGRRFQALGLSRFCSAAGISQGVLALEDDLDATAQAVLEKAQEEQARTGAEAILLGCTGMIQAAERLRAISSFPVIEPSTAAIKALETLVSLGLSHPWGGTYTP